MKRGAVHESFASFFVSGSELAVPVGRLQEVVPAPASPTVVPLSPDYLIGVFRLRDRVLPVIDTAVLLGLKPSTSVRHLVAVVRVGEVRIGLRVDETGEIIRLTPAELYAYHYTGPESRGVLSGAAKLGETRLLQLVDPDLLVEVPDVPHAGHADARDQRGGVTGTGEIRADGGRADGSRAQCLVFGAGRARLALPVEDVQEIVPCRDVEPSALGVPYCPGFFRLRGLVVPLVDLSVLLRGGTTRAGSDEAGSGTAGSGTAGSGTAGSDDPGNGEAGGGENRVIVVRLAGGPVGLLVSDVSRMVTYDRSEPLPLPRLGSSGSECFTGYLPSEEGGVILVDASRLLTHDQLGALTRGHSKLYKSAERGDDGRDDPRSKRSSYLVCRLDSPLALDLGAVQEIVEYPSAVLRPPSLPEGIDALMDLRGTVLPLVDTRKVYGLGSYDGPDRRMVVVTRVAGEKAGVVVDSVDAIAHIDQGSKRTLPALFLSPAQNRMKEDLLEVLEYVRPDGGKDTLCVLDYGAVAERLVRYFGIRREETTGGAADAASHPVN